MADQREYSDLLSPFGYGNATQQSYKPADPAVGAQLAYVVPGGWAFRIIAVRFTLTTDAGAGSRYARVQYLDGDGDVMAAAHGSQAQAANSTTNHTGMARYNAPAVFGSFTLPDVFLHPGWSIQVGASNLDAADQVSSVRLWVEQYPIGHGNFSVSGDTIDDLRTWGL